MVFAGFHKMPNLMIYISLTLRYFTDTVNSRYKHYPIKTPDQYKHRFFGPKHKQTFKNYPNVNTGFFGPRVVFITGVNCIENTKSPTLLKFFIPKPIPYVVKIQIIWLDL
jgi:hypothetical protein